MLIRAQYRNIALAQAASGVSLVINVAPSSLLTLSENEHMWNRRAEGWGERLELGTTRNVVCADCVWHITAVKVDNKITVVLSSAFVAAQLSPSRQHV